MSPGAGLGRAAVPGSERSPLVGAKPVDEVDPDERLAVTVVLRRGGETPDLARPESRVEREQFAQRYGARPEDMTEVERFAADSGLRVAEADAAARTVTLTGTAAAF